MAGVNSALIERWQKVLVPLLKADGHASKIARITLDLIEQAITDQNLTAIDTGSLIERICHAFEESAAGKMYDESLNRNFADVLDLKGCKLCSVFDRGIETLGQLIQLSGRDLMCIRHVSEGTVERIRSELNKHGLKLKNDR